MDNADRTWSLVLNAYNADGVIVTHTHTLKTVGGGVPSEMLNGPMIRWYVGNFTVAYAASVVHSWTIEEVSANDN